MPKEEQIDMFMTLLQGDMKHTLQTIDMILKKMETKQIESITDIDDETSILYNRLIIKRDTLAHVQQLANICFKL